ncbi:MAG: aminodeoxychorismate/anthranilate synthase component II [Anaerolineales bacterium]|nr:aminodeoxychorismate/anthranilate synthase component II [Anaerolineales bacterium]
MLILIDNYDSFTYNLVQYLEELGAQVKVFRNDEIAAKSLLALNPSHVVISPGPGGPQDAGISKEVVSIFGETIPLLGVCLGQQCIAEVYGGQVVQAANLMHGKTSRVYHYGDDLYTGVPNPFVATRYHSLMVNQPLPTELEITAYTQEGEIMGLRHRKYPLHGVQFHPESILTPDGKQILSNFLVLVKLVS